MINDDERNVSYYLTMRPFLNQIKLYLLHQQAITVIINSLELKVMFKNLDNFNYLMLTHLASTCFITIYFRYFIYFCVHIVLDFECIF